MTRPKASEGKRLSAERLARRRDKLALCRKRMPVAVFDEVHGVEAELHDHIAAVEADLADSVIVNDINYRKAVSEYQRAEKAEAENARLREAVTTFLANHPEHNFRGDPLRAALKDPK